MKVADYTYKLDKESRVLLIADSNLGGVSLTNSIEQVVKQIEHRELVPVELYVTIQRDSNGEFSQVTFEGGQPCWRGLSDNEVSFYTDKYFNAL